MTLAFLFLLRTALAVGRLAFAENLFKRTHLGEVHVARGAAQLAVRPGILRPNEIGDELIGLYPRWFEGQQVAELALFIGRGRAAQRDRLRFAARDGVSQPVMAHAEIVPGFALEYHL